jgi:hypothetical protein
MAQYKLKKKGNLQASSHIFGHRENKYEGIHFRFNTISHEEDFEEGSVRGW